jgi:hypothetical protein
MRLAILASALFAAVMFALIAHAFVVGSFWQEGGALMRCPSPRLGRT